MIGTAATSSHTNRRRQRAERLVTCFDDSSCCGRLWEPCPTFSRSQHSMALPAPICSCAGGARRARPRSRRGRRRQRAGSRCRGARGRGGGLLGRARRAAVPRRRPPLARAGGQLDAAWTAVVAAAARRRPRRTAARHRRPVVRRTRRLPYRGGDGCGRRAVPRVPGSPAGPAREEPARRARRGSGAGARRPGRTRSRSGCRRLRRDGLS